MLVIICTADAHFCVEVFFSGPRPQIVRKLKLYAKN